MVRTRGRWELFSLSLKNRSIQQNYTSYFYYFHFLGKFKKKNFLKLYKMSFNFIFFQFLDHPSSFPL